MDQEVNPYIQKILDYAKGKTGISYDEIAALVGQDFTNSPKMEQVLQLLAKENIEVVESGLILMKMKRMVKIFLLKTTRMFQMTRFLTMKLLWMTPTCQKMTKSIL